jgi:hypothetical protein
MAVCCQTLTLGALSSRSALSMLVGAFFKKFDLFLTRLVFAIIYFRIFVLLYKGLNIKFDKSVILYGSEDKRT